MIELFKSEIFNEWLDDLKDRQAKARIEMHLRRLSLGNFGDAKFLREGIHELRIDCGQGYRVYFTRRGAFIVILLCGGDKSTQEVDIKRAITLASDWKDLNHD
jgi:putative addiction module killer protein